MDVKPAFYPESRGLEVTDSLVIDHRFQHLIYLNLGGLLQQGTKQVPYGHTQLGFITLNPAVPHYLELIT